MSDLQLGFKQEAQLLLW